MLYLIGLGLNKEDLSLNSVKILKKCFKVYLENYTVNFPYNLDEFIKNLEEKVKKTITLLNREKVENLFIINESKNKDIALLVYGSPLTATTHISLIEEAKKLNINYKIVYNSSILDAIGETGLEIYKFGKVTSIPKWQSNFKPKSFMEVIKDNQSIKAHSLLLVDIDLDLKDAIKEIKEAMLENNVKINKVILCSCLGTEKSKIFYLNLEKASKLNIEKPYCFIIPGSMHFIEKEILESYSN